MQEHLPQNEALAITEGLLNKEAASHQAQPFWVNPSQIDPVRREELMERLEVDTLD